MRVYTFKKTDRITKRTEYLEILRIGKKVHSKYFIINYLDKELNKTRLGITVSKKVGGAVTRNRYKRLVREYFRLNKHLFSGSRDINLIIKKEANTLSKTNFTPSLNYIFGKLERNVDS